MSGTAYDDWYKSSGKPPPSSGGGGGADPAVAVFTSSGCAACHTFKAIPGANGKVGPDLDDLSAAAKRAGVPLEQFIHDSIVDPNSNIAPGYQPGAMPPNFGTTIPADKLDATRALSAENTP